MLRSARGSGDAAAVQRLTYVLVQREMDKRLARLSLSLTFAVRDGQAHGREVF